MIPDESEKRFQAFPEGCRPKHVVLQIADVKRGLLSVSKATAGGNRGVFDQDGSHIENKFNGERTLLKERN